ncbi:MAG TPA: sugar phosphate isomerase/epimerase family protein [Roseimicrobium sp.]|nr:sugar phosphate isomerase/epimerase family protein [Roseimicrobium sp.]
MKFGICNEIFQNWKLEDAMAYAKKAGYDGIEIAPFTICKNYVSEISADQRREIREPAARIGIAITGIHWVLVQAEGMYVTHPDTAIREKTARYFVELVDFCGDIGGKRIIVGSPKQRNLMEGVSPEQGWKWALDVFRSAVKRAEERGIIICFEPLAPAETNFINTAEDGIRFTNELNSPSFKIIIDVKAMSSESKPIPQIIRESSPNFSYFHANDANLKGPGFGEVDFHPIAAALKEVGYQDWVSVEVFKFEEGPEVIATKSIEYLKKVFAA